MLMKRERKKIPNMVHNRIAHELLVDAGTVYEPRLVPLLQNSDRLYTGHGVLWCGISLWPAQVTGHQS